MKSLKDYILESVEFEKIGDGLVVCLVRREGVSLKDLSEDEFVQYIQEDYQSAMEEYKKLYAQAKSQMKKDSIEREVQNAVAEAEKLYKRASNKEKYIAAARINAEKNYERQWRGPMDLQFDFKAGTNVFIVDGDMMSGGLKENGLRGLYSELRGNKYFLKGDGWAFKYSIRSKDCPIPSFRPYIDILLDESTRAEAKRDKEIHDKNVLDFCKDLNYWGD